MKNADSPVFQERGTPNRSSALKFTSSMQCGGCVGSVAPYLDAIEGIESWTVDTESPEKTLTVQGTMEADVVIAAVRRAGFAIERIG